MCTGVGLPTPTRKIRRVTMGARRGSRLALGSKDGRERGAGRKGNPGSGETFPFRDWLIASCSNDKRDI